MIRDRKSIILVTRILHNIHMRKYCLLILTLIPIALFGQSLLALTESTRAQFDESKKKEIPFSKNSKIVKNGKVITIKTAGGKAIKFEDDVTDESYETYEYTGDLIKDTVVLVKKEDYNSERFIAVALSNGNLTTLIGTPHILGDKIICLQGAETDVTPTIELWSIQGDKLTKIKSFSLPDEIYPTDLVWKAPYLAIIEDSRGRFWTARVDG